MPSVFIKTYGCQMNERDSEAVLAQLAARGYELASTEGEADVILLNTCSVRDLAEQKALGKMQALVGAVRRHRPRTILGYLGCMAQSRGASLTEQGREVRLVLGTQKLHHAADHLEALQSGRTERVVDVGVESGSEGRIGQHLRFAGLGPTHVKAFVSIMQGCNQRCTFCIVPFTRGEERSRSIPDIVAECERLASLGVREITLLGQIVTSYGRRVIPMSEGHSPFVQLLDAIHGIEGIRRIRFTSPHPKGYGGDLIDAYGRLPKLCSHAHLPMQSGSDKVLKAMHRGYTRARFLEIVSRLRKARPDIGIGTDIIVGFPGETEDDFRATLEAVREAAFDQAYLFKYSPRRDTPATRLPNPVPEGEIEERHRRLLDLVNEIGSRRYEALLGREVEVLVEGPSHRNPARLEGRTGCNKIVVLEGSERHVGQLLDVRVTRIGSFTLYGEPVLTGIDGA